MGVRSTRKSSFGLRDGTVALPSLFFVSDRDTGIYRVGDDRMGLAAGGIAAAIFDGRTTTDNVELCTIGSASTIMVAGVAGTTYEVLRIAGAVFQTSTATTITALNGLGLHIMQPSFLHSTGAVMTFTFVSSAWIEGPSLDSLGGLETATNVAVLRLSPDARGNGTVTNSFGLFIDDDGSVVTNVYSIRVPNVRWAVGSNAAGTAVVNMIRISASDGVVLGPIAAAVADAFTLNDGTVSYYAIDTRLTAQNIYAHAFLVRNPTIASAAGTTYSAFSMVTAGFTVTLTGGVLVTAMPGINADFGAPTVTSAAATTVTTASAVRINGPIPAGAGPVTFTNSIALDLPTYATNGTTASGIRIAGPTGAGTNWALNVISGAANFAGGMTLGGNLDMANNLILNIGAAGTDFTAGGGLTLAALLTANLGITVVGAAVSLLDSSNFATSINGGTSTGSVTIGNTVAGAVNITSNAASTFSFTGGTFILGTTSQALTIRTVTSGTLTLLSAGILNHTSAGTATWTHSGGAWALNSTSQDLTVRTLTSGTLAITSAGAYNETAAAASTFVNVANTASAWQITDGTASYYAIDTRTGVTTVLSHTFSAAAVSFASAAGSAYQLAGIAAHTLTLTGGIAVTGLDGLGLILATPTVTSASATTVTDASTLFITAPTAAGIGPVTITRNWALQTAGHIGPDADNTYTLGVAALRWSTVFGVAGNFSGLITGTLGLTITGAVVSLNASSNFATNINTGTSTGAVNIGNSAAGIITIANSANVAATMLVTDGTANYYALDTRTGVTGVLAHAFDTANLSFASAAGSAFSLMSANAFTLTLTGGIAVTALDGLGLILATPTVTSASATTVTDASTLFITAPTAAGAGPVTITNNWAIQTAGHVGPDADNTYTLGNAARRWSNLFTVISTVGDLVFANDWKITEGNLVGLSADELILVSPAGRKYRFVLEEVA